MESEKVKEIKNTVRYFADKYMTAQCIGVPKRELFAEILTIINELETENERLMKLQARGGCRVAELGIENQQLKDRIAELEDEIERLETVVDIANERSYRKKFIEEWRKEYQKELDKEGEGHIAGFPDFDLVYKLYFEQKDRIAELETENAIIKNSVAMRDYKTLEEMSNNKVKQFAERLKEKLGSVDLIRGWAIKVFIDETLKEYE